MTIELCRRSFLFGAAATVAAVRLPILPGETAQIIPQPVIWPDARRAIYDIMLVVSFDDRCQRR